MRSLPGPAIGDIVAEPGEQDVVAPAEQRLIVSGAGQDEVVSRTADDEVVAPAPKVGVGGQRRRRKRGQDGVQLRGRMERIEKGSLIERRRRGVER